MPKGVDEVQWEIVRVVQFSRMGGPERYTASRDGERVAQAESVEERGMGVIGGGGRQVLLQS